MKVAFKDQSLTAVVEHLKRFGKTDTKANSEIPKRVPLPDLARRLLNWIDFEKK